MTGVSEKTTKIKQSREIKQRKENEIKALHTWPVLGNCCLATAMSFLRTATSAAACTKGETGKDRRPQKTEDRKPQKTDKDRQRQANIDKDRQR
jgi:hypothetical protein